MTREVGGVFARTLVDEWVRAGVTEAVIAPGSRSTELALAAAERLVAHVFHDERSAAFFALGIGMSTGLPAMLISTSGTAGANFHPAVIEADASRIPMIVCTADRPPELRDTGANQTIDQHRLYGVAVRWFVDPGVADEIEDAGQYWRSIASRAIAEAIGRRPGPVHLNIPLREPFDVSLPTAEPAGGRPGGNPWTIQSDVAGAGDPTPITATVAKFDRGVILAGQGAGVTPGTLAELSARTGWPVLADPLSGLRGAGTITTYDALVRSEEWAAAHYPLALLRFGRPVTSKVTNEWLEHVYPHVVVARDPEWLDPHRAASHYIVGDPEATVQAALERIDQRATEWTDAWRDAEAVARRAMDTACDSFPGQFEGRIARDALAGTPPGTTFLVGSSMPVRDLESFAGAPIAPMVRANRGASGIDGTVSTALGVSVGSESPVVCLLGDLAFLHDSNGLITAQARPADVTFVVIDNDGGGIFHFLPQASHPDFERLFGAPHGVDIPALAAAAGVPVELPGPGELANAVAAAVAAGGVRLLHVATDRHRNIEQHRAVWAAVAAAVS